MKRNLDCQNYWFLTRNEKSDIFILDSCEIPKTKNKDSLILVPCPLFYLALLCLTRMNDTSLNNCSTFRSKPFKDGEVCQWRQAVWHNRVQWVLEDDEQAKRGRGQYRYFGRGIQVSTYDKSGTGFHSDFSRIFDKDKDGFLTTDELGRMMKSKMANVVWSQPNSVFFQFPNVKCSFVKVGIEDVIWM